jgi:hypothetical protein
MAQKVDRSVEVYVVISHDYEYQTDDVTELLWQRLEPTLRKTTKQ